jgi:metallo-beta-lactamase family protein
VTPGVTQDDDGRPPPDVPRRRHGVADPPGRDGADEELYDEDDVDQLLSQVAVHPYGGLFRVGGLEARLRRAGHILGSATIELRVPGATDASIVYSGDLGRAHHPMLRAPDDVPGARTLLIESAARVTGELGWPAEVAALGARATA